MPIVIGEITPPPPPTFDPPQNLYRQTPQVLITDVDGVDLTLGGEGTYLLQPGAQGMGLAPVALTSDPFPDGDGSTFRGVRLGEREIFLPVLVMASDYTSLRDARRTLERQVDPKRGSITLTVVQPDGERRYVEAWYTGGAEGSYGKDTFGVEWQSLGLTFRALDPFWYGDTATRSFEVFDTAGVKAFLEGPFLPFVLTSTQVIGTTTVDNPGDLDSYPTWVITGPGNGFIANNAATGKQLEITGTIAGGDSVHIDTRRFVQTIEDQDGANLWGRLVVGSSLWPLLPGEQTVNLTLDSTDVGTRVDLSFTARYRSAV